MTAPARGRLRAWVVVVAVLLAVLGGVAGSRALRCHLRAIGLLLRAQGSTSRLAHLYETPIVERDMLLQGATGPFRARIIAPADGVPRPGLVLAHGVHYMGIDEPRLRPFARALASTGMVVLIPELRALADYRILPSTVDQIGVAVRTLAHAPEVTAGGVGVLGLSFAGGLALVANCDPSVRSDVAYVATLGGHHDLYRVSEFLATDRLVTPTGVRTMHAHDYGLIVYVYAHAEDFVQGPQLPVFRDALRQMLHEDRPDARRAARTLTGDARRIFDAVDARDKATLRPLVMQTLPALHARMEDLSPARCIDSLAGVPVVILHGAADDVMPPTEAEDNARELSRVTSVRVLISPNIHHVTLEGTPTRWETWRILHAMAGVLGDV